MKICFEQFLSRNHSWCYVGQNISRAALKQGHEVHLKPTDGLELFPKDLKPYLRNQLDSAYDAQISYTAPRNFQNYLSHGTKNRFGIWNYEFTHIPPSFIKPILSVDKFLPSSTWFYNICREAKIPDSKMCVVPHGVDWETFEAAEPLIFSTRKSVKFLMNFGQPHIRKNIAGTLEAYGRAFHQDDNVCLIIKAHDKKPESSFEVSFSEIFKNWELKYPKHAEVIVIKDYVDDMAALYKACDCLLMLSNCEAFSLPNLEILAAGGFTITSNYGGQLDFLTTENAMLVSGKLVRAPVKAQYWEPSVYSAMFEPDIDDAVTCMKAFAQSPKLYKQNAQQTIAKLKETYTWDQAFKQIENLCQ